MDKKVIIKKYKKNLDTLKRYNKFYFEKDNPLFKRELFLKKFFLKREVSQQLDKAHKHLNSMHSLAVKCFKCSKPLDVVKINYVMLDDREACYPCA